MLFIIAENGRGEKDINHRENEANEGMGLYPKSQPSGSSYVSTLKIFGILQR